jgi:hypothetical protein
MAPQRLSKTRFETGDETSPRAVTKKPTDDQAKSLGLTTVDSAFAIGQAGGVVVVMQELHDESAFDTGDFAVAKSRSDKRKDAQKEREREARREKEEERKAALAAKKEEEARAAREAAAAKEAARKATEEEKRKKAKEEQRQAKLEQKKEKESRGPVPAPPPAPAPAEPARPQSARKDKHRREAPKASKAQAEVSEGSKAILQDSAVVGIGNVISKQFKPAPAPVVPERKFAESSAQTDPVRILPVEQSPKISASSTSAAAAWWLQQASGPAPQTQAPPQQPPQQPQNDQYMMQAYIDAMQRMSAPAQPSGYGYWTAPAAQAPSAADMYWQQQQNVYQSAPRYTAPRRIP